MAVKSISYRKLKSIDTQCLKSDISESTLCSDPSIIQDHLTTGELDALVRRYQDTLTSVIDHHAPTKTRIIVARPKVSWYNEEIDKAKRARRKAERIWRRTRSLSDLKTFKMKRNHVVFLMNQAKSAFYTEFVHENGNDQGNYSKQQKLFSLRRMSYHSLIIRIKQIWSMILVNSLSIKLTPFVLTSKPVL